MIEWMTAGALVDAYAARSLSPVEVARALIERIERLNPTLGAYLTVDPDAVLAQARRAEAALFDGEPLGPLHGVPVSLKDTIETAGLRSTSGSALRAEHVPAQDAIAVERLRASGAIILGKTNTAEFAASGRTTTRIGPEAVNPWDTRRTAGGSSGGAGTAVSAGLGPIGIGTDAGGSIRYPAAFNGVFGLMPSLGTVPKRGCVESDDYGSLFSSIGPLARDVRDAARALQAMAGQDPRDPTTSRRAVPDFLAACDASIAGMTMGWLPALADALREPGVEEAIRAACDGFIAHGARMGTIDAALTDPMPISGTLLARPATRLKALAEDPVRRALLAPYVAHLLSMPMPSAEEEDRAWQGRRSLIDEVAALFGRVDIIAAPVTCFPAPLRPDDPFALVADYLRYIRVPSIANVAGLAAASLPCGFHDGMPIGLMLMAPHGQEARLLSACAAFERARPWADRRPSL